jgi:hypothetical protein
MGSVSHNLVAMPIHTIIHQWVVVFRVLIVYVLLVFNFYFQVIVQNAQQIVKLVLEQRVINVLHVLLVLQGRHVPIILRIIIWLIGHLQCQL